VLLLDASRGLAAGLALMCYGLICVQAWRRACAANVDALAAISAEEWQVVYASQTGTAEMLAQQSAESLRQLGFSACCYPLNQLTEVRLASGACFLFVVSTAGDGEAPDNGARFARDWMDEIVGLPPFDYGLLSLGDSHYPHFNGFGRRLDTWLEASGGRRRFDRVELDRCNEQGVTLWQYQLARLAGTTEFVAWETAEFTAWELLERQLMNPGSQGQAIHGLRLVADPAVQELPPSWESGDIAQIQVPSDPEHPREYSIASLPQEGSIQLLVRHHLRDDGSYGLASSYLAAMEPGERVLLRIRPHPGFRLAANQERPLILIGNGVGLAALRAHLQSRISKGKYDNWLIFGERNQAHDALLSEELEAWCEAGKLVWCDRVFSRDGEALRYVQDVLRHRATEVIDWVERGAAVYVCGSRTGMGEAVDATLTQVLGRDMLDALSDEGRYLRDLF